MTAYSNLIAHLADYCLDSRTEPEALVLRNEQIAIVMLERGAEVTDYISERLEAILADVAGDLSLTRDYHCSRVLVGGSLMARLSVACTAAIKEDLQVEIGILLQAAKYPLNQNADRAWEAWKAGGLAGAS